MLAQLRAHMLVFVMLVVEVCVLSDPPKFALIVASRLTVPFG